MPSSTFTVLHSVVVLAVLVSSSLALVYGVDSATQVSEPLYAKAQGEGFTKAIIRGYQEACSLGGQVDPNFVSSYQNARAAGFTNIDMYWLYANNSIMHTLLCLYLDVS
jgi:hypothetical protein